MRNSFSCLLPRFLLRLFPLEQHLTHTTTVVIRQQTIHKETMTITAMAT